MEFRTGDRVVIEAPGGSCHGWTGTVLGPAPNDLTERVYEVRCDRDGRLRDLYDHVLRKIEPFIAPPIDNPEALERWLTTS